MAVYGTARISKDRPNQHSMEAQRSMMLRYGAEKNLTAEFPEDQRASIAEEYNKRLRAASEGLLVPAPGPHMDFILESPGVSAGRKTFVKRNPRFLEKLKRSDHIISPKLTGFVETRETH
jgi:hypothetical protein